MGRKPNRKRDPDRSHARAASVAPLVRQLAHFAVPNLRSRDGEETTDIHGLEPEEAWVKNLDNPTLVYSGPRFSPEQVLGMIS